VKQIVGHGMNVYSRNGDSRELVGWSATLENPSLNFLQNPRRAISPAYACAELIWYLSRSNEIAPLVPYAPQYKNFAEPDGTAYGAYGNRVLTNVAGWDQLQLAAETLRAHGNTRQCVVSLWKPDDLFHAMKGDKRDLPCTLMWQFLLREGRLHMIATMRSNDVWLGLPYDLFVNTCIQRIMAAEVGAKMGTYTHCVGSLHLYDKHRKAADAALDHDDVGRSHEWQLNDSLRSCKIAVKAEERIRAGEPFSTAGLGDMLLDAVNVCGQHHGRVCLPCSPVLMKGMHTYADSRGTRPRRKDDDGEQDRSAS
jgi:thymidylate synthase